MLSNRRIVRVNDPQELDYATKMKGLAHITGGGLVENIPRVLLKNCSVTVSFSNWVLPEIFSIMQKKGNVPRHEMYRVFNMGIGMVIIADAKNVSSILKKVKDAVIRGEVVKGNGIVQIL